jgi:hypothetical protein
VLARHPDIEDELRGLVGQLFGQHSADFVADRRAPRYAAKDDKARWRPRAADRFENGSELTRWGKGSRVPFALKPAAPRLYVR